MPLIVRAGAEVNLAPAFLQVDASPSLLMPLGERCQYIKSPRVQPTECGTEPFRAYLDVGLNTGLRAWFGLMGGVRLQGSFVLSDTESDRAQVAVMPFVGYESPSKLGVFARYGVLMTLDTTQASSVSYDERGHRITHRFTVGANL